MPRVAELKHQYMKNDIGKFINGYRVFRNMTQGELADMVDMSQQNLSRKIRNNSFTYVDLIRIFKALKLSDEDILKVMKL